MINIVAVDDSKEYLEGLKSIFTDEEQYHMAYGFSIFEDEYNIEFMLQKIGVIQPDVILMDFSFILTGQPYDFGIELVRRILQLYPKQKIIMLVGDEDDSESDRWTKIRRSFAAGAQAYLSKQDISSWKDAISEVVNGENYINEHLIKTMLKGLRATTKQSYNISGRQREVLIHLAADKTAKQVADSIQGADGAKISVHTVNFHLRNIRSRLNCKTLHGVIAKALKEKIIE